MSLQANAAVLVTATNSRLDGYLVSGASVNFAQKSGYQPLYPIYLNFPLAPDVVLFKGATSISVQSIARLTATPPLFVYSNATVSITASGRLATGRPLKASASVEISASSPRLLVYWTDVAHLDFRQWGILDAPAGIAVDFPGVISHGSAGYLLLKSYTASIEVVASPAQPPKLTLNYFSAHAKIEIKAWGLGLNIKLVPKIGLNSAAVSVPTKEAISASPLIASPFGIGPRTDSGRSTLGQGIPWQNGQEVSSELVSGFTDHPPLDIQVSTDYHESIPNDRVAGPVSRFISLLVHDAGWSVNYGAFTRRPEQVTPQEYRYLAPVDRGACGSYWWADAWGTAYSLCHYVAPKANAANFSSAATYPPAIGVGWVPFDLCESLPKKPRRAVRNDTRRYLLNGSTGIVSENRLCIPWSPYLSKPSIDSPWPPNPPPPPGPTTTLIVPVLRIYRVFNNVVLTRVGDGAEIPASRLSLSLDASAWTWSWSATIPGSALGMIRVNGDPVELLATINGEAIRLRIDSISRSRSFAISALSVSGRGRAAVLAAPTAASLSRYNSETRTARQLLDEALTDNGISIGWDLDWLIEDWSVTPGAWSHTGTYIEAATRIAEAGGGYVQGHDTAQTLRILPYYPAAPWDWAETDPDIVLPEDVCKTEGIEWSDQPIYNSVWVTGTRRDRVRRTGTAGDINAQTIVDALATDAIMTRQRGLRVLADAGRQAQITLGLPVIEPVGIVRPGKLVQYSEQGQTHLGLSRSVRLEYQFPTLWQSVKLEVHPS